MTESNIEFISEYNGEAETKIICDRTRTILYDGSKLHMNTYECSSCKTNYYFEQIRHSFCPFCGIAYKFETDASA